MIDLRSHGCQLIRNPPNPACQYSKSQTKAEEIEKCLTRLRLSAYLYSSIFKTAYNAIATNRK